MNQIKLIAYYLPQYYEIEFNNKYWGKGYTEWTTVAKARPLFKGHYQPHVPADLGFYNLLMPEIREMQAGMAREYGIDGFCYWHYWFGENRTIMERPFNAVVESGEPDFPFCLCWANHSWHNPKTKELILEQRYYGEQDHIKHFNCLLKAFKDDRYIKIDGRPIFAIFEPLGIPDIEHFIELWNGLADDAGFDSFYFIGLAQTREEYKQIEHFPLDAINTIRLKDFLTYQNPYKEYIKYKLSGFHNYSYKEALKYFISDEDREERNIPTLITGWDHSPRGGRQSLVLTDYTPETFEVHLRQTLEVVSQKKNKLCFVKAWNEWGEGNYLEPDLKWGLQFLDRLQRVKKEFS